MHRKLDTEIAGKSDLRTAPLQRLETILRMEYEVLLEGDFQKLGELLCEKLHIVENLGSHQLDPKLLKRCWRLNRDLMSSLPQPAAEKTTYRR